VAGLPVRGRNAAGRAAACWLPVAPRLTPHGLRQTLMDRLDMPSKLKDERMGHIDGSVQARYSHITAEMRRQLLDGLTDLWDAALDQRLRSSDSSPVGVLDALLREHGSPASKFNGEPSERSVRDILRTAKSVIVSTGGELAAERADERALRLDDLVDRVEIVGRSGRVLGVVPVAEACVERTPSV
jgi:hypothetical protein